MHSFDFVPGQCSCTARNGPQSCPTHDDKQSCNIHWWWDYVRIHETPGKYDRFWIAPGYTWIDLAALAWLAWLPRLLALLAPGHCRSKTCSINVISLVFSCLALHMTPRFWVPNTGAASAQAEGLRLHSIFLFTRFSATARLQPPLITVGMCRVETLNKQWARKNKTYKNIQTLMRRHRFSFGIQIIEIPAAAPTESERATPQNDYPYTYIYIYIIDYNYNAERKHPNWRPSGDCSGLLRLLSLLSFLILLGQYFTHVSSSLHPWAVSRWNARWFLAAQCKFTVFSALQLQ